MGSAEFLTVVAVSGGVAYIAVQAHKRLFSDFMDKIHSQFESTPQAPPLRAVSGQFVSPITPGEVRQQRRSEGEKKVHFSVDVVEPSSDNKDYRRRKRVAMWKSSD